MTTKTLRWPIRSTCSMSATMLWLRTGPLFTTPTLSCSTSSIKTTIWTTWCSGLTMPPSLWVMKLIVVLTPITLCLLMIRSRVLTLQMLLTLMVKHWGWDQALSNSGTNLRSLMRWIGALTSPLRCQRATPPSTWRQLTHAQSQQSNLSSLTVQASLFSISSGSPITWMMWPRSTTITPSCIRSSGMTSRNWMHLKPSAKIQTKSIISLLLKTLITFLMSTSKHTL